MPYSQRMLAKAQRYKHNSHNTLVVERKLSRKVRVSYFDLHNSHNTLVVERKSKQGKSDNNRKKSLLSHCFI